VGGEAIADFADGRHRAKFLTAALNAMQEQEIHVAHNGLKGKVRPRQLSGSFDCLAALSERYAPPAPEMPG
jgi:hypothetical protein